MYNNGPLEENVVMNVMKMCNREDAYRYTIIELLDCVAHKYHELDVSERWKNR